MLPSHSSCPGWLPAPPSDTPGPAGPAEEPDSCGGQGQEHCHLLHHLAEQPERRGAVRQQERECWGTPASSAPVCCLPLHLWSQTQSRAKENGHFRAFLGQGWVCAACSKGHVCPQGYVCYKPLEQRACYLRRMEPWDLQTALNTSEHSVSSCCSIPGTAGGWTELCTGSLSVVPVWLCRGDSPSLGEQWQPLLTGAELCPQAGLSASSEQQLLAVSMP